MSNRELERSPSWSEEADGLRILWSDSRSSWFHYVWLRENCRCESCSHPAAWERTVSFASIPLDLVPQLVTADTSGIRLEWPEHDAECGGTRYSWRWLEEHSTELEARRAFKRRMSTRFLAELAPANLTVDYASVMSNDDSLRMLLEFVLEHGFALVSGMPTEPGTVLELARRIAFVEESHFGRWFDVESKPNPDNLAYTSHALPPHNDLPSRRQPPGVQLLHALCNEATGGESILVDGIAVAERIRSCAPASFELLSSVPVRFTSVGDTWEISNRACVIELDEDGDIAGTRFHPALLGPVDVEPALVGDFYRAHRMFLEIATDPEMQLVFRLASGSCQIFDNKRMLHARRQFDPSTGKRHFQGCYVNLDDLESRLHVLRRAGADFRTH